MRTRRPEEKETITSITEGSVDQRQRYQRLLETTNAVPWEVNLRTFRYSYVGPQAVNLLGYPVEDWYKRDFWVRHILPEDREFATSFCRNATQRGDDHNFEYRMVSADGRVVWLHDIVCLGRSRGRVTTLYGFLIDITSIKETEEALRVSEAKYRDLYDHGPDMYSSIDATGKILSCNEMLLKVSGFSADEIISRSVFDLYHPDSRDVARKAYEAFLDSGVVQDVELQITNKQGDRIDVSLNASAVRNEAGAVVGSRSVWRDITKRKKAETELRASEVALRSSRQNLRRLTGRVLTAQEEERRRVARDLHDDFSQRLAGLAIELASLEKNLSEPAPELAAKVGNFQDQLKSLSSDLHTVSHQLHPAILDELGLFSAIESECERVTRIEGLKIDYTSGDAPSSLPKDIAIGIYRVTQEALRNVVTHAQASEIRVSISAVDEGLFLSVEDNGIGFVRSKLQPTSGIGIAGMRERIRHIDGRMSVKSQPGRGTKVEVYVPLEGIQ